MARSAYLDKSQIVTQGKYDSITNVLPCCRVKNPKRRQIKYVFQHGVKLWVSIKVIDASFVRAFECMTGGLL